MTIRRLTVPAGWHRGWALTTAAALAFTLVSALTLATYASLVRGRDHSLQTVRDYRVLGTAEQAMDALMRAESAYRQFLVTGRDRELELYDASMSDFQVELATLLADSIAAPAEARLWKRIGERADAWKREAVLPSLALRRAIREGRADPRQLEALEATGNSAQYFAEIRALVQPATDARRVMVARRLAEDDARVEAVQVASLCTAAVLAALGVVILTAFMRLRRTLGQLQQADAALVRSDAELRAVVESVREVIFRADGDGRWELLTPAWAELTGYAVAQSVGQPFATLVHDEDRERVETTFTSFARSARDEHRDEFRIRRRDGQQRWVNVHVRAQRSGRGQLVSTTGTLADVTEQRELEARLRQSHKMEAMGQLAGGIAHDFNNLLTVIHTCADLALSELPTGSAATHADLLEIQQTARRAADLTQQLLAFSRRDPQTMQVIDLNERLRACESLLTRLLPPALTLLFDLEEDAGHIEIDPAELEQIVVNLVINARDAMPRGGTIVVRSSRDADAVLLAVIDDGVGMDLDTQQRIFEPFFTTKPIGRGTGLGLATVYGIAERAGAVIDVDSTLGRGTQFSLRFPAATGRLHSAAPRHAAPDGTGGTVLLVEDEATVRRAAARMLRARGFAVIEARHGADALTLLARHPEVRVVLSDLLMPEMGGWELAERLRTQQPELPVVFMSGYPGDLPLGTALGAHAALDLLKKPFSADELLTFVRSAMARPAHARASLVGD